MFMQVDSATGRIILSLKQSSCSLADASFIQEYFLSEEKIAKLQLLESQGSDIKWDEGLNIGNIVDGKIQEWMEQMLKQDQLCELPSLTFPRLGHAFCSG